MSAETLAVLEAAVAAHVADEHTGYHSRGWVLGFQASRFQPDPTLDPVDNISGYIAAEGTSAELAIGLCRVTTARIERVVLEDDL
ncbi:hypothetical protein [Curtobacterium sp. MCBA15_012]|uniref:hypothetical protein n=1 Tax=Curtobacterium sp. MCBA15_012 TaxID=1898738 RepID=UPI0008DE871D|nr:hypothetical protein [Curtobacterium sp. MCBA15_012]WIA99739.1 hypothetical protein QOL15_14690 [Curtobacterium sp. MCBA15_012]